jgi:O-antigen/teichoic acid export membrane protein
VRRAVRTLAAVSMPIALALSLSAPVIVPLLFGHRFSPAVMTLTILAWSIPLAALSAPYAGVLIARDRMTALMWNNVASATFAVVGYGVAIPLFGINGAAVVRVAAAGLSLLLNYRAAVAPQLAPRLRESFGVGALRLGWVNGRRSG